MGVANSPAQSPSQMCTGNRLSPQAALQLQVRTQSQSLSLLAVLFDRAEFWRWRVTFAPLRLSSLGHLLLSTAPPVRLSRTFCCLPSHPLLRVRWTDKEVHMAHLRPQRQKHYSCTHLSCFCHIYLNIVNTCEQILLFGPTTYWQTVFLVDQSWPSMDCPENNIILFLG